MELVVRQTINKPQNITPKNIDVKEESTGEKLSFEDILKNLNIKGIKIDNKALATLTKSTDISLDDIASLNIEDLAVEDLVKLVAILNLKDGSIKSDFVEKNFKQLANNVEALKEFKEAKDIKSLISLANKYNLNISKIDITEQKSKQFDNILQTIQSNTKGNKTPISLDKIESLLKQETPLKTLSILDKQIVVITQKDKTSTKNEDKVSTLKSLLSSVEINTKKEIKNTAEAKVIDTKIVEEKTIQNEKIQTQELKQKVEIKAEVIAKVVTPELKKEAIKEKVETKFDITSKTGKTKQVESPKDTITQNVSTKSKEVVAQVQNVVKTQEVLLEEDITIEEETKTQKMEVSENKTSTKEIKDTLNNMPKVQIKESLAKFSTTLEDQVKDYKPPMMKVKMALNPLNLGEIDVTIISRGNNININLTSNTSTMAIFTQNQAEFKNAISNLGFSEFNMSFQDKDGQKQEHKEKESENNDFEYEEDIEEETTSIDILTPKYI